jgi:hypothetical protein
MTTPRDSSGTGAYSVGAERPKRRFPWWLLALLALLLLALLLLALSQCGTDAPTRAVPAATDTPAVTEEPTTSPEPTVSAEPTTPEATPTPEPTSGAGAGAAVLTAGGTALLPLADAVGADGDLSQYVGQSAKGREAPVQSVPADEGFWVGDSKSDRVWVQLIGKAGESDYQVQKGDKVDLDGEVVKTPSGFAKEVGVNGAEGAKQLKTQEAHIEAAKSSIKLSK